MFDVICTAYIAVVTILMIATITGLLRVNQILAMCLLGWHTLACLGYWQVTQAQVVDAHLYFDMAKTGDVAFGIGTIAVAKFTSFFAYYLGFSFFNTFLVYNFIGALGLIFLAAAMRCGHQAESTTAFAATALLFLPGLSFWSSAIGKDAPAFLSVCMFLFATLDLSRRKALAVASILIMLVVRPHIAVLMGIALAGGVSFGAFRVTPRAVAMATIFAVLSGAAAWIALEYTGLAGKLSAGEISEYLESRQGANEYGTSAINLSGMTFPEQVFAYLFRPLFFDARGLIWYLVSFENLILLLLLLSILTSWDRLRRLAKIPAARIHMILMAAFLLLLAPITDNSGLAIRQKIMILPSLLFLVLTAWRLGRVPSSQDVTSTANM